MRFALADPFAPHQSIFNKTTTKNGGGFIKSGRRVISSTHRDVKSINNTEFTGNFARFSVVFLDCISAQPTGNLIHFV